MLGECHSRRACSASRIHPAVYAPPKEDNSSFFAPAALAGTATLARREHLVRIMVRPALLAGAQPLQVSGEASKPGLRSFFKWPERRARATKRPRRKPRPCELRHRVFLATPVGDLSPDW